MNKIESIEERIRRGKEHFSPLWDRYDKDFELWKIQERVFDSHENFINRTSNKPRSFADKCQGHVTRAKMDIRVKPPTPITSPESMQLASKIERMLQYGFYQADKRLLRIQQPDLKSALAWHAINRGRIATRILVYEEDDRIVWDYLPLDPRHLVFGLGGDDVAWFAYRTFRSPQGIEDKYNVELEDKTKYAVEVWDYWDRDDNCVICYEAPHSNHGSRTLKKATKHNLPRPPISLVTVPTNPSVFDEGGISVKYDGESVYAPNRLQYKQIDQLASLLATHSNQLLKQPIVHLYDPNTLGEDGKPITLDKATYYPGAIINLPATHKLDTMPARDISRGLELDYSSMRRDEQMATFADIEYGLDQPPHSGTALEMLREDKQKVLLPRLMAMQFAYSDIVEMACEQIKKQDLKVVSKTLSQHDYMVEEVTKEDLEDAKDFYMKVDFVLSYPYEDLQTLALIEMAKRLDIISTETAREDIAKIPDSEAEGVKVAIEKAAQQNPEILLWQAVKGLKREGRDFEAKTLEQQLQLISEQRNLAIAQIQRGGAPGGEQ